ncbi:class E sortase [Glaciihabitans arcticus]|uniref:Class E sortase n=1 Tax=Glaciihabitans arcticus TaxID=2668039 RepID=A0A4V2JEU9_9MICO|nr:sortase [Glaciihabitans arcticus]TBN57019.1 class E sortase [Glaciihabitans arcticus]
MTMTPIDAADASPVSRSLPRLGEPARFRVAGTAAVVIGALLFGFFVQYVGVSQLSYARDQQVALDAFRYELANATAPVGQVGPNSKLLEIGTPVALLEIPVIRMREVVLEGTTSSTTVSGPAHRRDTPLPGQAGASVVYGRQASYGAPFRSLSVLRAGDKIIATTGQGEATYRVTGVRYTGDELPEPMTSGGGRLTLVSASGVPFIPDSIIRVDAKLTSEAQPSPGKVIGYAALDANELTMEGDAGGWPLLVIGLIALFVTLALFTVSRRFWGRWQTWIVAVPVLMALGSFSAQQVAVLLPNVI